MVWPFIHACHLLKSVNGHLSYNKQRLQQKDLAFVVPQRCLLSTVGGSHHISFSHTYNVYIVFLTHETTSTSESQSATHHLLLLCNDVESRNSYHYDCLMVELPTNFFYRFAIALRLLHQMMILANTNTRAILLHLQL